MLQSQPMSRNFRPDLENSTREDAELAFPAMQPVYVTGLQLEVDAGALLATTTSGAPA